LRQRWKNRGSVNPLRPRVLAEDGGEPGARLRKTTGEPTMARQLKTESGLASMIIDALKGHGFPTVRDVFLYKVIDKSSSFSWSISTINIGQEDDSAVRSALQAIQRALQEQYDLSD
jgi:hypothetical protein